MPQRIRAVVVDPSHSEKLTLQPMLATSWRFSNHGKALTFDLRHGVKFHDGTPVDAAAVKANIIRDKTVKGSLAASALTAIGSVTVVSKVSYVGLFY